MKNNFKFIDNENKEKNVELVIGFQANGKDYVIYSDEQLDSSLSIEDSKKEIKPIYIAHMLPLNDNKKDLKGLYDEEYKIIAHEIMNVLALNINASEEELYSILDDIEIEDFTFIDVENIIKNKSVVEDDNFEPRKIQAPLYYLKGMQNVYNKLMSIMPVVEEVQEINEVQNSNEDEIDNVINSQEKLDEIVSNSKKRKTEDSSVVEEMLLATLEKVKEIQNNNESDVTNIETITTNNAKKLLAIINNFAKEIQEVKANVDVLALENKKIKQENISLNDTIKVRDESINQLHINLSNETKIKEQYIRQVESSEKQIKELNHSVEEKKEENNSLKEENNEQKKVIEIFKTNEDEKALNSSKESKYELEISNLREELNNKNAELSQLKKENEVISLDKEAYEQSSLSLTQLITSKNAEARELCDRIKELEKNNDQNIANIDQGRQYYKAA